MGLSEEELLMEQDQYGVRLRAAEIGMKLA